MSPTAAGVVAGAPATLDASTQQQPMPAIDDMDSGAAMSPGQSAGAPARGVLAAGGGSAAQPPAAGSGGAGGAAPAAGSGGAAGGDARACTTPGPAEMPKSVRTSSPVRAQDPAIIAHEGEYFLFHSAAGVAIKRSSDLMTWRDAGNVFARRPAWIAERVEGVTELSAPDVAVLGGKLHVYYSAATPGTNRACIGHATSDAPTRPFTDRGPVICSNAVRDADNWNAVDPQVVQDDATGKAYLVFGSYWSGIKLIELDASGARAGDSLIALAARAKAGNAVSAPFIVRRCDAYYLFVAFDRCCDGVNSDSRVVVGRSAVVTGPYLDRSGVPLLDGGGTPFVQADDTWKGPGQSVILAAGEKTYELHHAYFAGAASWQMERGAAYLRISELSWDADGWPVSAGP